MSALVVVAAASAVAPALVVVKKEEEAKRKWVASPRSSAEARPPAFKGKQSGGS